MVDFADIPATLVAPIFTFEVSSGGQFENQSRLLLIGFQNSDGLMDGNPLPCPTTTEARRLAGAGSMLDDMVRIARRNAPSQEIWILNATEVGTAEIRTITVDSVAAGQGAISIAGEPVSLTIASDDTVNSVATALAAAINAYYNPLTEASLPFTATVATDTVTITARHKGAFATGIDIAIPDLAGGNAFTGALTIATGTPGAGLPDLSTPLANLGDDPFDWIACAFNDDDNIGRLSTLLSEPSGRWGYERQIYGHALYCKTETIGNLTTHALALNDRHLTVIPRVSGGGYAQPEWQWAAAFMARIAPWLSDGVLGNVSRNQTGLKLSGLDAPRTRSVWPVYSTRQAFLANAISTWSVNSSGDVQIDKIITTERTVGGVTDTTFRDIQKIGQLMYGLRKFRADLYYEHGQKSIADDNPGNLGAISTVRDIKATIVHSYQQMVASGVLENDALAVDKIVVQRNSGNPNRVDALVPLDAVNPLDIFAGNARVYSQFDSV